MLLRPSGDNFSARFLEERNFAHLQTTHRMEIVPGSRLPALQACSVWQTSSVSLRSFCSSGQWKMHMSEFSHSVTSPQGNAIPRY